MGKAKDPTLAMREAAASYPAVAEGTSCNQASFKVGKGTFLFVGPGAKGIGFKAMFKLDQSLAQAKKLADRQPERFQAGSTGWVTTRFSAEKPLPKTIWKKWLKESYDVTLSKSSKPKRK